MRRAPVTSCASCGNAIPGEETISEAAALAGYHAPDYTKPAFCSSCGKPYPWTDRSLQAGRELASEMEGLSDVDREALAGTLPDLLTDTPRTQAAATRFRRLMGKVTKTAGGALREFVVNVASEAAKRTIFGPGASP